MILIRYKWRQNAKLFLRYFHYSMQITSLRYRNPQTRILHSFRSTPILSGFSLISRTFLLNFACTKRKNLALVEISQLFIHRVLARKLKIQGKLQVLAMLGVSLLNKTYNFLPLRLKMFVHFRLVSLHRLRVAVRMLLVANFRYLLRVMITPSSTSVYFPLLSKLAAQLTIFLLLLSLLSCECKYRIINCSIIFLILTRRMLSINVL